MESNVHAGRRRAQSALGAVCLVLAALAVAFFQIQVVRSPAPAARSEGGRLQAIPIPAPRGVIVDRTGAVLAEDVEALAVSILPASVDSVRAVLVRLVPELGLSDGDVQELLARREAAPDRPLLVTRHAPPGLAALAEDEPATLGGLWVGPRQQRRYPAGAAAAHVVGMLGEAEPSELVRPEFRASRTGALVGRAGAELRYERRLAGVGGMRYVRVDMAGRVLGPVPSHPALAPTPGEPLQLTVDAGLQLRIAELVDPSTRAGVVALEAATGAVLALYSSPSFDPNLPAGLVLDDPWSRLRDDPAAPLLDRAIGAAYAPGFPWAVTTAVAAVQLGIIDGATRQPMACRGGLPFGERYFRCSDPRGHGSLTLSGALQQSCDVYFYQVALKMGLERVIAAGTRAGFGRITGIDLPGEAPGALPADGAMAAGAEDPVALALELGAGTGPVLVSALQLARFYAALVSDGPLPPPRVSMTGSDLADAAGANLRVDVDAHGREGLEDGLRGPARPRGLSHGIGGLARGTDGQVHEWFVGMSGREATPGIVVVVVIEGGNDGLAADQVAAGAVAHYLSRVDPVVATAGPPTRR